MKKKPLLIGCVVALVLAVIGVVAFVVLVLNAAKAPYSIDTAKISVENINSKDTFGRFKKIDIQGVENPMTLEGVSVLFLSSTGEMVEQSEQTQVVIASGMSRYDEFVNSAKQQECNFTEGSINSTKYFKGTCGTTIAYIYIADDKLVAFQVQGSESDLAEVVADFNK